MQRRPVVPATRPDAIEHTQVSDAVTLRESGSDDTVEHADHQPGNGSAEPTGGGPPDGPATRSDDQAPTFGGRRAWLVAALFVLPYFLLMLTWTFSNPPGAAPDERDHLVKAIGMASLNIGTEYTGSRLQSTSVTAQRNASISRVIPVPLNLAPNGYDCTAFKPKVTAACQPTKHRLSTDLVGVTDPLGSYPPFLYAPIGWAARLASTPAAAFLLARIVCLLACSVLLLLGAAHLVRGLGGRALLGAFVALTPMVLFSSSVVSTSGMEMCAAFATACIVVVGLRHPETLSERGTHWLLAGVGATLILSRQLGVVTFGLLMVLLLVRVGPRFFWDIARRRQFSFLSGVGILVLAGLAIVVWESRYDHPAMVGSAFNSAALGAFAGQGYVIIRSGVAMFGWLDTAVPPWFIAAWIILLVLIVGMAILVGRRVDRWTLGIWLFAMALIAYFTYATVFFPVRNALQGRHILAFFTLVPLLAGVVVNERTDQFDPAITHRLVRLLGLTVPALQMIAIYVNARRYAVGSEGPVWFLSDAKWEPVLGWVPWLLLGLAGSVLLGRFIFSTAKDDPQPITQLEPALVQR